MGLITYTELADRLDDVVAVIMAGHDDERRPPSRSSSTPTTTRSTRTRTRPTRRLRDEAPLYHNDELDFWVLSRHADVLARLPRPTASSPTAMGVSLDPSAWGPHAHRTMSFLAHGPAAADAAARRWCRAGFTPRRVRRARAADPADHRPLPRPRRSSADELRLHRRLRRQAADGRHLRADRRARRPTATRYAASPTCSCTARRACTTCRRAGIEAAFDAGRLLRRHARPAASAADRRPHLARCWPPRSTATGSPTTRSSRFLFLMVVAGNETTTKLLGNALVHLGRRTPTSGPRSSPTRAGSQPWIEETLRYDTSSQMLARHLLDGRRAARHGRSRPAIEAAARARLGQPRRAGVRRPGPLRPRPRPRPSSRRSLSFGGGRHFCLGATLARLEARSRSRSWCAGCADYDVDHDGAVRVHSVNVRGFAAPADHGGGALMPQFDRSPSAGPPWSPAPRPGIGAATAVALAAAGHPGRARRPARRPAARRSPPQIRADGGEAVGAPLDLTDDARSTRSPRRRERRARRRSRSSSPTPATVAPGVIARGRHRATSRAEVDVNLLGAHRLVARRRARHGRAAARRHRVRVVRRRPCAPRPFMAAYAAGKWGLEGLAHAMQMELEGTGVRVGIVRPGPTWSEMGTDLGRRRTPPTCSTDWVRCGLARHPHFLKPAGVADAIAHRRVRAARRAPQPASR